MVGLLTPGGVLSSPQPAQEVLSHVFCPRYRSRAAMWHFFPQTPTSPLTICCSHFTLTRMHTHSHFARVRMCYPRSDFLPEVLKCQLSISPSWSRTRLLCLFFFSPLAGKKKKLQVWFSLLFAYPLPEILGSWWLIPLTSLLAFLFFSSFPPPRLRSVGGEDNKEESGRWGNVRKGNRLSPHGAHAALLLCLALLH